MTHLPVTIEHKDLERIGRIGGWAPGSYVGKCSDCGAEIIGDKRSIQCLPCAVIALKAVVESDAAKPADVARSEGIDFAVKAVEVAIAKVKGRPMKGPFFVNPTD